MADSDDFKDLSSLDIEAITPLRKIALEVHELQGELKRVGFPDKLLAEVIAHLLYDLLMYRPDVEDAEEDDEDLAEDEDEDFDDALDDDEFYLDEDDIE